MYFNKKMRMHTDTEIVAPVKGKIFPISEVSDTVFSEEILGQSISICPSDGEHTLVSPANGTLEVLYPTGHAYAVKLNNGIGLLVHIGIDTVELNGRNFTLVEKQNNIVQAGQPIVRVNFNNLRSEGYDASVMVIVIENPNQQVLSFKKDCEVDASDSILM